jgi:flagellin
MTQGGVMNINGNSLIYNINKSSDDIGVSSNKISTGDKIYQARLDPSGLSISERLQSIINGTLKEMEGEQMNISMNQTAEGGLSVINNSLQRMYELGIQSKNGTLTTEDRGELQKEVTQLKDNINHIANSTEYNRNHVLAYADTEFLKVADLDLTDTENLNLDVVKDAIDKVNSLRSDYGAKINGSEHKINNLVQQHYNTTESYSAIRDVDIASEVTKMTSNKIKNEMSITMLKKMNDMNISNTRSLLGL